MKTTDDLGVAREDPAPAKRAHPITGVQRVTDELVRKSILWLFPSWIRPNHLTIVRFVLTPVVLLLLYYDLRWWAFAVFLVAVSTDFIDGAMARTRGQISPVGMIIDPIADKLLIGAVLAWIGYEYLVVQLILASMAVELILMTIGLILGKPGDRARPANAFGKAKMVIQSIALIMFFIAAMLGVDSLLTASLYLLGLAIFLAVLSGGKHISRAISEHKQQP